jgi:hypothetical protein
MNTPRERTVIFEKTSGRYDFGPWTVKGDASESQTLTCLVVQPLS